MHAQSTRFCGRLARLLALAGAIAVAPLASAEPGDFSIETRQGPVESLDTAKGTIVVGGVAYAVAPDANVQLGGTYGAFTLIAPGMNVEITLKRYVDTGRREIIEIDQLPPGVVPQQY